MEYCIIEKLEFVDEKVKVTAIGYSTNHTDCDTINSNHDNTLGAWVNANYSDLESGTKTISEFFATTPIVHTAKTTRNYIGGLTEITDISGL